MKNAQKATNLLGGDGAADFLIALGAMLNNLVLNMHDVT